MAQYDGSVRINTEIETKKAKIQLTSMENRIVKAADKVDSLRSKMDALKDVKTPTQEYKEIADQIKKAEQEFNKLFDKQEQMQREGKDSGAAWDNLNEKMDEVGNTIRYAQGELQDLVDTGKAFTLGSDSEEFAKLEKQLKYAENDLDLLNERYDLQSQKLKKTSGETDGAEKKYSKLRDTVKKLSSVFDKVTNVIQKTAIGAFKKLGSVISGTLKKATSAVSSLSGKIKVLAQKHMPRLRKETSKTNSSFSTFGRRIKELLLSALIFNRISAALNSLVSGAKEGLNNLVMYSDRVNDSMSMLMSSMTRLKNSLATAFAPILNVVAPILSRFIDLISEAATKVGMFFAALTGQTTFEKAIKVQQDYRESLEGTAKAEKEAAKEQDKYLSGLDEIRRWESNKDEDEEDELKPEDMFTTVPVENSMVELADKVKDVFKKLFAPLKEAWNREGKFVMDSWKYALKEVWKLAKDIGRDFLKVWNQEATIAMLADMLHIIGDIGLIVGNLAGKFREAWNYNNTGLHILENIRDIFAVIVHNVREAADYTVEWTKTLDFRPLLTSIENLTSSLIRFADFVSGTLVDFYTEFILPLASWSLSEQGLPRLFNILASFMDSINWEGLRSSLKSLYQALEPYAEEIGNGLLDFIEKMKDEGVEFFNFLPGAIQRAADALRAGDLPAAFMEFGSIAGEAVRHAFSAIRTAIDSIPWGEIGTSIASFINGIPWDGVLTALFGSLTSAINGAIDLLYNFIMTTDWTTLGAALGSSLQNAWNSIDWQQAGETIGNGIRGILDFLLAFVQEMDWEQIGRDIGTLLDGVPWGEIFTQLFAMIWEVLSGLISGLLDTKSGKVIVAIGAGILAIKALFNVADFALSVAQWATGGTNKFSLLISGAKMLKTGLSGIMSGIGALFSPTGLLIAAIAAGVILIITHWDDIKEAAGKVKDWVVDKFEKLKDGVKDSMEKLAENCGKSWEKAQDKFQKFDSYLSNVFRHDWSREFGALGEVFNGFLKNLENMWNSVKQIFGGIIDFVAGVFTGDWERAWNGVKSIFEGVWNLFASIVKSPVNAIIGILNALIRGAATMVNNIAQMLNSLHIDIPDWVPGIGGGKLGFNIPTWTPGQIPYLATGAVIPPNREFMAVLGDQKHGNNIEAPESLLRKIVREEAGGNQSGSGNYHFTANINRRVLFDEIIEEGKLRQTVTGQNPFEMA